MHKSVLLVNFIVPRMVLKENKSSGVLLLPCLKHHLHLDQFKKYLLCQKYKVEQSRICTLGKLKIHRGNQTHQEIFLTKDEK